MLATTRASMGACQVNRNGNRTETEPGGGRTGRNVLPATALALSGGCALMANSTTQSIDVTSTPPGAQVLIDGRAVGETPLRVELPRRRRSPVLRFEKEGYWSEAMPLRRSLSWHLLGNAYFAARPPQDDYTPAMWVGANVMVWGLDFATGGAFAFPSRVEAEMTPAGSVRTGLPPVAQPPGSLLPSGLVEAEARSAAERFRDHRGAATAEGPATSGGTQ
ncbi:MAG: PEGA domain-containing protein [Acidobacteria bacterium]|nr:PEGA domain-containing protein [Acidobacteriota bacterium]